MLLKTFSSFVDRRFSIVSPPLPYGFPLVTILLVRYAPSRRTPLYMPLKDQFRSRRSRYYTYLALIHITEGRKLFGLGNQFIAYTTYKYSLTRTPSSTSTCGRVLMSSA